MGGAKKALDGVLGKLNEGESPQVCGGDSSLRLLEGKRGLLAVPSLYAQEMKRLLTGRRWQLIR